MSENTVFKKMTHDLFDIFKLCIFNFKEADVELFIYFNVWSFKCNISSHLKTIFIGADAKKLILILISS